MLLQTGLPVPRSPMKKGVLSRLSPSSLCVLLEPGLPSLGTGPDLTNAPLSLRGLWLA